MLHCQHYERKPEEKDPENRPNLCGGTSAKMSEYMGRMDARNTDEDMQPQTSKSKSTTAS